MRLGLSSDLSNKSEYCEVKKENDLGRNGKYFLSLKNSVIIP